MGAGVDGCCAWSKAGATPATANARRSDDTTDQETTSGDRRGSACMECLYSNGGQRQPQAALAPGADHAFFNLNGLEY